MKNLKFKLLPLTALLIGLTPVTAQEKTTDGEVKVVIMKDDNGTITKESKTFSLEEQEKINKLLKENGVDLDIQQHLDNSDKEEAISKFIMKVEVDEEIDGNQENKQIKVIKIDGENSSNFNMNAFTDGEFDEEALKEKLKELKGKEGTKVMVITDEEVLEGEDVDIEVFVNGEEISEDDKNVIVKKAKWVSEDGKTIHKVIKIKSDVMLFRSRDNKDKNDNSLPTKIEEQHIEGLELTDLKLFPNPTNGNFNMSFIAKEKKNLNLNMIDAKGAVVYEKKLNNFKGNFNEDFDLSSYEKGIYFFNILSEGNKVSKKIILK